MKYTGQKKKKNYRLHTSYRYIQNVLEVKCVNKTVLRIAKGIISLHPEWQAISDKFSEQEKRKYQRYYRITANTSKKIKASRKKSTILDADKNHKQPSEHRHVKGFICQPEEG